MKPEQLHRDVSVTLRLSLEGLERLNAIEANWGHSRSCVLDTLVRSLPPSKLVKVIERVIADDKEFTEAWKRGSRA